jgi:hypothetical protein
MPFPGFILSFSCNASSFFGLGLSVVVQHRRNHREIRPVKPFNNSSTRLLIQALPLGPMEP